jgi:phosphatidylinositol 4-kinase B
MNSVAIEQLREIIMPDIISANSKRADIEEGKSQDDRDPKTPLEKRGSSSKLTGLSTSGSHDTAGDANQSLAPTGDIRRAVLTTIMMRGIQGNTIAAGAADSVQRSLKELERRRATELLLSDDDVVVVNKDSDHSTESEIDTTRQKLTALALSSSTDEAEMATRPSEEDEVLESIRLILIQNQVAQGQLSPADAARVLQHTSLSPINARKSSSSVDFDADRNMDDLPTIDAGDVDARLVGCGALPPAVLQAMTLWKGGMVSNAELLELVKKDMEFVKHSVLVDTANLDAMKENSAFWARFSFGERWAEKKARIGSCSPQGVTPGWDLMGVIVKSNDDLRQEAFVMQLIELCQEAFELAGLELWVSPYRILATGRTTGVIECVRNAMSFDALKKRPGYGKGGLREHLQRMAEFTADPGGAFKAAQQNFVRSLAAYSLISYLFLLKDRHNGNLLLDTAGHVIHIDFGFAFGIAPGGSFSLEMSTPFKLTEEMLDVMGGLRSPLFCEFVTLFCCGFLALQAHCDTFLTIIEITSRRSTFKCFEGRDTEEIVQKMRERLCPELSKEDTVSFALDLIKQATTSYGTRQYDLYQYLSQGIVA